MKNKFIRFFSALLCVFAFSGCAVSHALRHPFATTAAQVEKGSGSENPTLPPSIAGISSKDIASLSKTPPAPAESRIAAFFADVTRICVIIGALSLLAGGALIYFGSVIPGVKCIAGGIALPVAAIWLDYHYGIVIWCLCIGSAIGFFWALKKYDPTLLASLDAEASKIRAKAEAEISALVKKI